VNELDRIINEVVALKGALDDYRAAHDNERCGVVGYCGGNSLPCAAMYGHAGMHMGTVTYHWRNEG
jgi:hypothetical protein